MAYKKPLTAYFTNEKLHEDFVRKVDSSGKKKSAYVMKLIEDDVLTQDSPQGKIMGVLSQPFVSMQKHHYNGTFEYARFNFGEAELKKDLMKSIDEQLRNKIGDFRKNSRDGINILNPLFIVILKLRIKIMYSTETIDDVNNVKGSFHVSLGLFDVTEELWGRYNNNYDLTTAKYVRFVDAFRNPGKIKNLAFIMENPLADDMSGGFFMKVSSSPLKYPTPAEFEKSGFIEDEKSPGLYVKVSGVDCYKNINRLLLLTSESTEKVGKLSGHTKFKF